MNTKIKFFTFIIIIISPFIIKAQITQLGDSLIIRKNIKPKDLYLKLRLPKDWKIDKNEVKHYSLLEVLYNNSKKNKIFINFNGDASYTRDRNKAEIKRQLHQVELLFFGHLIYNPYPSKVEIINQNELTVDTYPALMVRAKITQEKNNLGLSTKYYRTSFLIFHKGLAIKFHKNSQYENDSKNDQKLFKSMAKSITFPNKNSDEQLEAAICAVCADVNWAKSWGEDMPPWKETMEKYLGFKGNDEEFKIFFHNFLNTYKNQIICPRYKVSTRIYPPQHLFKRILAVGMNETFEEYFFNLEDGEIDYNAYEIVNGKKETILDWVENWIALGRGDAEELRDVAYGLKDEFGAKLGKDLTTKESKKI
jgi:hypothetical protein